MNFQKNLYLIVIVITSLTSNGLAQDKQKKISNYYFGFKSGIKFGLEENKSESEKLFASKVDLGTGIETELFIGYQLKKTIKFELALDYFSNYNNINRTYETDYRREINRFKVNIIQVKPRVVLSTNYEKVNLYIKTGVNFGVHTLLENKKTEMTNDNTFTRVYSSNMKLPIGYHTNIGIEINLKKGFFITSELSYNELQLKDVNYYLKPNGSNMPFEPLISFPNLNPDLQEVIGFFEPGPSYYNVSISNFGFDIGVKFQM